MKTYKCIACDKESVFKHSKANKYCSVLCQITHQYMQYIAEWKAGKCSGAKGALQTSNHIRRYMLEKQNNSCLCGVSSWNGSPITLELDHIDGDSCNHEESNLRLLCPNCHSQTPTYKAKNKGRGRKNRKALIV